MHAKDGAMQCWEQKEQELLPGRGQSCHDGRVHPSTGGGQLHQGTDCRLADLEPGTTSIECEVGAR